MGATMTAIKQMTAFSNWSPRVTSLKGFLETPSLWGAVLIVALLAFMVLLLVLAGFLRKHSTDYEEIIEIEEDENDDN